jgi:hypothetical protein
VGLYDKYAKLYASNKNLLFPLIEKYGGGSMTGKTHAEAIAAYLNLLKTNQAFAAEVEALAEKLGFYNAGGIDPVSAVSGAVSSIFNLFSAGQANDAAFTQAVMQEQQAKNTQTLLIVGGITVASVGLIIVGIILAVRKKK